MMKALLLSLMAWASAHTSLPVPENLPTVERLDHCGIQRIAWPGAACDRTRELVAAYDPRTVTIYLPESWSPSRLFDVSVLLHELVHHMQHEAGIELTGGCPGERVERPAYQAQMDWLAAAGVDPHEVMGVNDVYLRLRTSCYARH